MGPRLRPIAIVAVSASLSVASCGRVGIQLLDMDGGSPIQEDDAGPSVPDASDLDADATDDSGTFDASDASADATADASDLPDTDAGEAGAPDAFVDSGPPACDFSGTWATKVEFAVSWAGNLGINGGSDTGYIWTRHQASANGAVVPGTMVACGLSMPGFGFTVFAGGSAGRVNFNGIPLFDSAPPGMNTPAVLQVQGAGHPGDAMTLARTALVIGASMADPLNGAWPSSAQLVTTDPDADGRPSVTVMHFNGGEYVYLPVAAFGGARAEAGYYAARVAISISGSVVSCSEASGQANVSTFDSHLMGCRRVGGAECSSTEVSLLESFRPDYQPGAGSYRMLEVANGTSCTGVRAALP